MKFPTKLLLLLLAFSPLSAPASVQYWDNSDGCSGQPVGIIEVVGSDSSVAACVAIGGSGRVWSIKVEGTCIDVRDSQCKAIFN